MRRFFLSHEQEDRNNSEQHYLKATSGKMRTENYFQKDDCVGKDWEDVNK